MDYPHPLSHHVSQKLSSLPSRDICLALSGGVDSIVLLHILKHIEAEINLSAVHINHGISANADNWTELCQKFCHNLNIPLSIEKINIDRLGGESLENNARIARHSILMQNNAEIIALAHHQNDQVETILSQLFRGSDLHNIAAMNEITHKQNKVLWRPLLTISRTQIEAYAALFKLEYVNDESNLDTKYLRNFIRHDILPLLVVWDNNILTKILNFNGQLQQLLTLTDEIGKEDLIQCCIDSSNINLNLFKQLSRLRQTNALSLYIKINNAALPSNKQLNEFIKQAVTSSWDSKPQLQLANNILLIKYKNNIFIGRK